MQLCAMPGSQAMHAEELCLYRLVCEWCAEREVPGCGTTPASATIEGDALQGPVELRWPF